MEEIENPTEAIQEDIIHKGSHASEKWISGVALSIVFLAVFAAVGGLLSGHHSNEALIEQIQAANRWSHYQSKSIKANLLLAKSEILESLNKGAPDKDKEKLGEYKKEQDEISEQAKEKEESSEKHLRLHLIFARSVTLFQIAIATSAIAILVKRRKFWYLGLGFGAVGIYFLVSGFL
jgi:hypothetical protein